MAKPASNVHALRAYPHTTVKDPVRPYRIWVAKAHGKQWSDKLRKYLPHRHYQHELNCHRAAWVEAGWAPTGTVLEVVDARTGKLLGQYRVHANSNVSFWR